MSDTLIELSIIIPAFNEEKKVRDSVRAVEQKCDAMRLNYEIILVNDGSVDGTLSRMQECAGSRIKVLSYGTNRGKGSAVRHGMLHATGKYRLFMDADLSTSLDAIDGFLEGMRHDAYDMIIGDRKSSPGDRTAQQPWARRFLGNGFITLSRWCVGKKIKDFTCGFKMFNQRSTDIIFKKQQVLNWAFDTELIAIALIHDLRIGEMPVVWNHGRDSAVRPLKDIFTSLAGLLKIKWNILRGVYRPARTISFELFPPKTPEGYDKLLATIAQLCALKPDFISCTYGAGGGSRDKTLDIVEHIQKKHGVAAVAHLTCVLHTKDEIKAILQDIKRRGISRVLALRGDPPRETPGWKAGPDNFRYSSDLVAFIRAHFGKYFEIGVAGFPEGHMLAPNRDEDARYLKIKIDAGADYVITQLFFNNTDYFDYVKRLRKLGVDQRVIPGILPITDYQALVRFCGSCGASIPDEVHQIFQPIAGDADKTLAAGIEFCVKQCRQLLSQGAPGLHFYTLNKAHPVDVILKEIHP